MISYNENDNKDFVSEYDKNQFQESFYQYDEDDYEFTADADFNKEILLALLLY